MSAISTDPQPVIDGRGATILGPRNVAIERQNPDVPDRAGDRRAARSRTSSCRTRWRTTGC